MADRRRKNVDWHIADEKGDLYSNLKDGVAAAILMDIRDELQRLNGLLHCSNFIAIPRILRKVSSNTANLPKVKK